MSYEEEIFNDEPGEFRFKKDDIVRLTGLVDFPKLNGQYRKVNFRRSDYRTRNNPSGCAYYLNDGTMAYTFESRLEPTDFQLSDIESILAKVATNGDKRKELIFDTPEKALQEGIDRLNEEYKDNRRFAYLDDIDSFITYLNEKETGCCGYYDVLVLVNGKNALLGCNYGH